MKRKRRCPYCRGTGWIPFMGRERSKDPQDWDSCDHCDGTGEVDDYGKNA